MAGQRVACVWPQDKALTIWLASPRPIYIGRKFFKQGVVDLAWAPDGRTLLACSTDGTVACFQFDSAELGEAVPQEARNQAQVMVFTTPPLVTSLLWSCIVLRHCAAQRVMRTAALQGSIKSTVAMPCDAESTRRLGKWHQAMHCSPLAAQEVDEHMQSQYGDMKARNAVFAESATQLQLEAAARRNDGAARPAAVLPVVQVGSNRICPETVLHAGRRTHCKLCCDASMPCLLVTCQELVPLNTK